MTIKRIESSLKSPSALIETALAHLLLDEHIMHIRKGTYALSATAGTVVGPVTAKREGYGLLHTKSGEEISISPGQMNSIWHGDIVRVQLGPRIFFGKREGLFLEVVTYAQEQITGQFAYTADGTGKIIPDDTRLQATIIIPNAHKTQVKPQDFIAVKITKRPTASSHAQGQIIENLGQANSPFVQTELAILRHDLPNKWSKEQLKQAKTLQTPTTTDANTRVDLRELPLMTIDGETARDFDDAVFACQRPRGGWRLWVAIADVSHYVPKDSPLDIEALNRSTSVYFPHQVVPMLPEELSNDLCSLKPDVDRLALVCEMAVSAAGKVTKFVFYEAIIRSHGRLTYTQVGAFLAGTEYENKDQSKTISQGYPSLCAPILDLYSLYQALTEVRQQRGALEFGGNETQFHFGAEGHIEDVVPVFRNDAHKLIEEMMLAANVCAAKLLLKHEAPGVFRNHEPPSPERITNLEMSLQAFGAKPSFGTDPAPKDFLRFLQRVASRPDGHILQTLMLRSMSQAKYEATCKGHFGLAYPEYAHFTSPIRRYPDLLVHRTIRYLIRNQKGTHLHREKGAQKLRKQEWLLDKPAKLDAVAQQNSDYERRADNATRDVVAWLKCSYMAKQIGSKFEGKISGVTHFGLFVTIDDLMIDGLIHISGLGQDYFIFNEQTTQLIGERSGFIFKIGDPLNVTVARVSLEDRKIDFMLTTSKSSGRQKSAPQKAKRPKQRTSGQKRKQ